MHHRHQSLNTLLVLSLFATFASVTGAEPDNQRAQVGAFQRKIINDEMYVKVRVDIYPSATGCHVDQYKKTFLIGNIDINDPQQAVMGQIYDLGDDFANIINKQLTQESRSFISVGTTDYAIDKQHPER